MYESKKEEGGFYELKMTVNKNGDFVKEFNYDVRVEVLQKAFDDYDFADDFNICPGRKSLFLIGWQIY